MIRIVSVFAACAMLAACSQSTAPGATASPSMLGRIAAFSVDDLNAAAADAKAHGDVIAAACYPALAKFITDSQAKGANQTVQGAFSAFQAGRDLVKGAKSGIPTDLVMGCAPLVQDATSDVNGFMIKLAGLAAGGAVAAPLVSPLLGLIP